MLLIDSCTAFSNSFHHSHTLWNAPKITYRAHANLGVQDDSEQEQKTSQLSLFHLPIDAIAQALQIRSENRNDMPLRISGDHEGWEITLTAGKIAQSFLEPQQTHFDKEALNLMGARIVSTILRLEELEDELIRRCYHPDVEDVLTNAQKYQLGIPPKPQKQPDFSDLQFCRNRAESLLAIFLDAIESPARKMDPVPGGSHPEFLDAFRQEFLITNNKQNNTVATDETPNAADLHSLTITAIAEALKLRAENKLFSPLRWDREGVEKVQIMVTAGCISEEAIQRHDQPLSPKETKLASGRIVAVALRLTELEERLRAKCQECDKIEAMGLLSPLEDDENNELIDQAATDSDDFCSLRAKSLFAIYLEEYERPAFENTGRIVPDEVDFLDPFQREILFGI